MDELTRAITKEVYDKHKVILTAVGIYSVNTSNDNYAQIRDNINRIAVANEYVIQLHGFYINKTSKTIRFDMVVSFDAPDRIKVLEEVSRQIKEVYPEYQLEIAIDIDFSE